MKARERIEKLERLFAPKNEELDDLGALVKEFNELRISGSRRRSLVQEEPIRLCIAIRDHPRCTDTDRQFCQRVIDKLYTVWRNNLERERLDPSLVYTDSDHVGSYYPYETGWPWEKELGKMA